MKKMVIVGLVLVLSFSFTVLANAADVKAKGKAATTAAAVTKVTLANLQTAYNGETNANARYLAFAKKADEEGYPEAASLFRATARAEQVHLERHAEVIKKLGGTPAAKIETPVVKSTKENIQESLNGETYETREMYPKFLKEAKKEKQTDAVDAFEDAGAAEGVHANLYAKALKNLDNMKASKKDLYICPKCGNVVYVLDWPLCPICKTESKKFLKVS